jgi:hypothetical protein
MNLRELILILIFCSVLVLLSGCQSSEPLVSPMAAMASTEATPNSAQNATKAQKNQTVANSTKQPAVAELAKAAPFAPPFPNRADMFAPPKRAQTAGRTDEHGEAIELKGFVNVDGPQVVLAIDGVISPIAEGGEKYGVHVISVHPPSVVLQRGRSRWTATLE